MWSGPTPSSSTARRYSPDSFTVDSLRSTKSAASAIVAESSSRAVGIEEPTALTWVPGANHSRSTIGSRAEVTVTTTSAPRTAASALSTASTGNGASAPAAKASACAGVRLQTRACSNEWARVIASRWARACTPEPRIASTCESGRARARVATAETAAVRIDVTAEASTSARSSPVSPSKSMTPPWCGSSPRNGLPGKMQTVFKP